MLILRTRLYNQYVRGEKGQRTIEDKTKLSFCDLFKINDLQAKKDKCKDKIIGGQDKTYSLEYVFCPFCPQDLRVEFKLWITCWS